MVRRLLCSYQLGTSTDQRNVRREPKPPMEPKSIACLMESLRRRTRLSVVGKMNNASSSRRVVAIAVRRITALRSLRLETRSGMDEEDDRRINDIPINTAAYQLDSKQIHGRTLPKGRARKFGRVRPA